MLEATLPVDAASVLALQRSLAEAVFMEDPRPLERDPVAFAAAQGLPPRDQAAFLRFGQRLMVYRDFVRNDLAEPIEDAFPVTEALLKAAGQWGPCLDAFIATRGVQSLFYRDVAATFLGWLANTGWGQDRWPFLLQLAHSEILHHLVDHHPGGTTPPGLHPYPEPGDRLVLDPATQVVTYGYAVHRCTEAEPVPAQETVHLLVHRDPEGCVRWRGLTPATAALVVNAQQASILEAAWALGLAELDEALALLSEFRSQGAILGFRGGR